MSQRLLSTTKWIWCVLVIAPLRPASAAVRAPPGEPSTIEAQAKFFQDFFSVQLSPYKIEFGHVCEDPNTWEQRYEKKDFENHRDMGKVRWGDKKGGYGEHYWDLNHAGNAHNHGDDSSYNDDGSYHEDHDAYDEPSEQSPSYDNEYTTDEYTPDKYGEENTVEENNRAKRAHTRHSETQRQEKEYDEPRAKPQEIYEDPEERRPRRKSHKSRRQYKVTEEQTEKEQTTTQQPINVDEHEEEKEVPKIKEKEKNDVVLVINHRDEVKTTTTEAPRSYVPYEGGAGVRHYQQAAAVPRLFLEPSTGHIVDRATGQAYVLQPLQHY